ncbi:MAG: thiaminase II [Deinococcus-Thermus bacterium]|jgi:thiaminase/transcriptional activator TenA|nr:thiaminase II [Deinococcota bacterium]
MTAPDYGRAFALWRDAAGDDWTRFIRHPFVAGLEDGTLPRDAFLRYLVQDYLFLVHFSRAWALAVVKSETVDEMKVAAGVVDGLVNHEMGLHVRVCAEAGIEEAELQQAREHPANLAYTRYVLAAGQAGDLADLLAALAPCVLGYGEIGARLGAEAPDGPYAQWIETYSGEEYQALCRETGALIDAALARRIGTPVQDAPRWGRLSETFRTATRLEQGFWAMGLEG